MRYEEMYIRKKYVFWASIADMFSCWNAVIRHWHKHASGAEKIQAQFEKRLEYEREQKQISRGVRIAKAKRKS